MSAQSGAADALAPSRRRRGGSYPAARPANRDRPQTLAAGFRGSLVGVQTCDADTPNPIGQTGRGIEIRGQAETVTLDPPLIAAFSSETLRIHPSRIVAWNIGEFTPAPAGRLPHMQGYNSRDVSR